LELSEDSFHFKIGNFECLVIRDGVFRVPDTQFEQLYNHPVIQLEKVVDVMCLLIRTENHTVLIDTGCGVDMGPDAGKLLLILQAEGIQCTDIDAVILTHGHPDHIGGNTDAKGKPVFTNAYYIISRREWEFLAYEPDLTRLRAGENEKQAWLAAVRKNLLPLRSKLKLFDSEAEILPGIKGVEAPGHTPGHTMLDISSGNERLICTGDLVQHTFQLEYPSWCTPIDIAPKQVKATREHELPQIAAAHVMVFASHFPFPGLGYIMPRGNAWFWQPMKIA
jgi:glyoxylase-like metal-dependent hydrolase (beta-lactamase superfamily II)